MTMTNITRYRREGDGKMRLESGKMAANRVNILNISPLDKVLSKIPPHPAIKSDIVGDGASSPTNVKKQGVLTEIWSGDPPNYAWKPSRTFTNLASIVTLTFSTGLHGGVHQMIGNDCVRKRHCYELSTSTPPQDNGMIMLWNIYTTDDNITYLLLYLAALKFDLISP